MLEYLIDMGRKDERGIAIERSEIESVQEDKKVEEEILERNIKLRLNDLIKEEDVVNKDKLESLSIKEYWKLKFKNENVNNKVLQLKNQYNSAHQDIQLRFEDKVLKIRQGDDLLPTCYEGS
jgi:DNA-directed RNA polymerase subunit beta